MCEESILRRTALLSLLLMKFLTGTSYYDGAFIFSIYERIFSYRNYGVNMMRGSFCRVKLDRQHQMNEVIP